MSIKDSWIEFNRHYNVKGIVFFVLFIISLLVCFTLSLMSHAVAEETKRLEPKIPYDVINASPVFINNSIGMLSASVFKWNGMDCLAIYNTGMVCNNTVMVCKEMND
jgi:hypothetical protein